MHTFAGSVHSSGGAQRVAAVPLPCSCVAGRGPSVYCYRPYVAVATPFRIVERVYARYIQLPWQHLYYTYSTRHTYTHRGYILVRTLCGCPACPRWCRRCLSAIVLPRPAVVLIPTPLRPLYRARVPYSVGGSSPSRCAFSIIDVITYLFTDRPAFFAHFCRFSFVTSPPFFHCRVSLSNVAARYFFAAFSCASLVLFMDFYPLVYAVIQ